MDNFIIIDTDILIDAGRKIKEAVDRLDKEEQTSVLGICTAVMARPEQKTAVAGVRFFIIFQLRGIKQRTNVS